MLYDIFSVLNDTKVPLAKLFPGSNTTAITELGALLNTSIPFTAMILEHMVTPEGTYPALGRSITYRGAAFQVLALAALKNKLPKALSPGQARATLTRVINATLDERAFDSKGWLRIGVVGEQEWLAESYITTGSVYLASTCLLPLGLSATHDFWVEPSKPSGWEKVWNQRDTPKMEVEVEVAERR